MNNEQPQISCDDVLDAFLMEADTGRDALEGYLRKYPQYAVNLLDLSREISRSNDSTSTPLSEADTSIIQAAWQRHASISAGPIDDPLMSLTPDRLNSITQSLRVPRQILTAFRERRIIVASVPLPFLQNLASAMSITVDRLTDVLEQESGIVPAGSYKSDVKPSAPAKITFKQTLIDAEVEADRMAELMSDE